MNIFEQALAFWDSHGTKALGSISSMLGAAQTAALAMNAVDPEHPFISVRAMILLSGAATFFGTWTIKRGFYNTANQQPAQ